MALGFPKSRPQMLEHDEQDEKRRTRDKAESATVRARSKGRCEVTIGGVRCQKRAGEVHHHIGGWKLRGRGESALAANKTHACRDCHRLITGNVLEHIQGNRYRSVRE